MYGSWICPKGKRSRPAQYIFPRGLRQMLGLVISTKTWAHVQLLSNDSSIQFRDVSPHTCSFPAAFFWSRARFSFSSPFRIQRERERERERGMAAMVVGALRRGSGHGGGGFRCSSRLLAQSLRRFVSSLPPRIHFSSPRIRAQLAGLCFVPRELGCFRAALISCPAPLIDRVGIESLLVVFSCGSSSLGKVVASASAFDFALHRLVLIYVCVCVDLGEHAGRGGTRRWVRKAVVPERIGRCGGHCRREQNFRSVGWTRACASQGCRSCCVQSSIGF